MDAVNKTLFIPLYGKALVSQKGILLRDPRAEEIWAQAGFALKGKSRSKWLAYYMAMRARVFDNWLSRQMEAHPNAVVLHLGCGLDSRCRRVAAEGRAWYDVDFPQVIAQRRQFFGETEHYHMVGGDLREGEYLSGISGSEAIVVMEGVSMYLPPEQLREALSRITERFDSCVLALDCYTSFAAKASRYKNPINEVGVTQVWGMDDPLVLEAAGLRFVSRLDMTPGELIAQLAPTEQRIFRSLYAGKMSQNLYRLYEYRSDKL